MMADSSGCPGAGQSVDLNLTDMERYLSGGGPDEYVERPRRRPDPTLVGAQHICVATSAIQLEPPKSSRRDKLAYFMDRILAKRSGIFLLMFAWGTLQVTVFGLLYSNVWLYEGPGGGGGQCGDPRERTAVNRFFEGFWEAWTFMADPGTHAKVYLPGQRWMAASIAIAGILFWSTIMALTVDVIRDKMDKIRQGRSKIIESGHTLILGWTEKTMHIIEELCAANASEGGGIIVVLSPQHKDDMESELGLQLPIKQRLGTRVVFRSGSPLVMGDLCKVSANNARSIIILASCADADRADADTLRTLLALTSLYTVLMCHVVAEVRDIDNEPLVKLVGGPSVEVIVSHDMIGRLMLMAVRQPGLAKVYEAMLGFEGSEFYMSPWPELTGLHFEDIIDRMPDAVAIGISAPGGGIHLAPPPETLILAGDKIIVIAEDNDSYRPEPPAEVFVGELLPQQASEKKVEKLLFCGWRRDIRDILQQLDRIVKPGTEVHTMTHSVPLQHRNARLMEDGLAVQDLRHVTLVHHMGNTTARRKLELLPIESYTSCMIFSDQEFELDTMHSDSHSLATMLLLRDIQARREKQRLEDEAGDMAETMTPPFSAAKAPQMARGLTRMASTIMKAKAADREKATVPDDGGPKPAMSQITMPIVCEVLDPHTQKTIAHSEHLSLTSDFCQSNRLVAQVMSMVSEERAVKSILDQLLSSGSCQIAVVPSEKYVRRGETLSFWAVAKRVAKSGDVLIGFQTSFSSEKTVLNPPDKRSVVCWENKDFAIIQGGASLHKFSESMDSNKIFNSTSLSAGHGLRTPDAWRRAGVWTGDQGDATSTGGAPASSQPPAQLNVEAAVRTFLRFMPEACETSLEALCLRLSCSELISLSDALQVLRSAISERPWARQHRGDVRGGGGGDGGGGGSGAMVERAAV